MTPDELDAAILAVLDGEGGAVAEAALVARLTGDDGALRRLAELMHLHGNLPTVLDELAHEGRTRAHLAAAGATVTRQPRRPGTGTVRRRRVQSWWRRWAPALAAAAAIVAVLGAALTFAPRRTEAAAPIPIAPVALLAAHARATTVERGQAVMAAGDADLPLAAQDVVSTAADGSAEVLLSTGGGADRSRVHLLGGTRLRWWHEGGERLELSAGRVSCTIAPQPAGQPLLIRTAEAEITVHGTIFSLSALPGTTRIAMISGTVAFRRLGDGVTLTLGPGSTGIAGLGSANDPGLVAAWPCNEGHGTVLEDAVSSGPPGILEGPATWTQEQGTAVLALADGASIRIPDADALHSDAFTIMAWIRPTVAPRSPSAVVPLIIRGEAQARTYDIRLVGDQVVAMHSHPDGYLRGGAAAPQGRWSHVALRYDGGLLTLLVDGQVVASAAFHGQAGWNASAGLRIGGSFGSSGSSGSGSFVGDVAQLRVFDRALSEATINQELAATRNAEDR